MNRTLSKIPLLGVLMMGVPASSCAPRLNAEPPVEFKQVAPDTLETVSPLRYGGTERFQALYTPNIRQLNLQGELFGWSEEYIRLGEVLAARPVNVQVSGLCTGGCASILFALGKTKTFEPQGVLALPGGLGGFTEEGYIQNLARYGYTALERGRYLDWWRQFSVLEAGLLRDRGISPALLRDARLLTGQYRREQKLDDLLASAPLWTPSAAELTCYGVTNIVGENGGLDPDVRGNPGKPVELILFGSGSVKVRPPEVSSCVR